MLQDSSSDSMQGSNSQDAPIHATESLQVRQRCLLWPFGQQDNSVSDQGQPIAARGATVLVCVNTCPTVAVVLQAGSLQCYTGCSEQALFGQKLKVQIMPG